MRAFKFLKVDFIRCKTNIIMITTLFAFIALVITLNSDAVLFPILYLIFVAVMFCGQPFALERKSESGFIDMLPGTKRQRVTGRYLFGLLLFFLALVLAVLIIGCYVLAGNTLEDYVLAVMLAIVGIGLIFVTIQLTILYSIGKHKSQQMVTIIQMIPGFVMLFGGTYIVDYVGEHAELDLQILIDNRFAIAGALFAIGVVVYLIGIEVCTKIVEKKDFA